MVGLDRGHIDRDRYREHRSHRCTSLLRHFLTFPIAPGLLPSRVPVSSATGALIPGTGSPVRGAARLRCALTGAKDIAAIARAADAYQHTAAPAAIQPVALLPLLHPTPPQHWTAPGCAGLNACAEDRPHRHRTAGGPGVLIGSRALLCLGVGAQLRPQRRNASQSRQSRAITDAGASAADRGRLRFVYV